MNVFELGPKQACQQRSFIVKEGCKQWFFFPTVNGSELTPTKTVSGRDGCLFIMKFGISFLNLFT